MKGLSVRDGQIASMLCNQQKSGPYPDRIDGDQLTYFMGPRSGPYRIERMIEIARHSGEIRVFEKLGVNRWLDQGTWAFERVEKNHGEMVAFIFRRKPS